MSMFVKPLLLDYNESFTTTNSYVSVRGASVNYFYVKGYPKFRFKIKNTGGSNGLTYQILASMNGTDWDTVVTPTNVAAGGSSTKTEADIGGPFTFVDVQVKAQVLDAQTTGAVVSRASTL